MKKLLTLLLALALVFSLAACGGSKTEEAKPAEEATPADAGPLADLIAAAKAEGELLLRGRIPCRRVPEL